jgi:hypothetical protein
VQVIVVKLKYWGWKHSMQDCPLKKVFSAVHTHDPVVGMNVLPPLQLPQSPSEAFQNVGGEQATHRVPSSLGLSLGQGVQAPAVISYIWLAGQFKHKSRV